MKKIHLFIILITSLLLQGCIQESRPKDVKLAYKVMFETANELKEKFGLNLIGTGGQMMYDINVMHLSFTSSKNLEIDEARIFLLECCEIFIKNINNFSEIHPYLHNFPVTEKNVKLDIYFKVYGVTAEYPNVAIAGAHRGNIVYYYKKKNDELEATLRETYLEALLKAGIK